MTPIPAASFPAYVAPQDELRFVLHEWLGVEAGLRPLAPHAGIRRADVDELMAQLARFAEVSVAPLNAIGDLEGCWYRPGEHGGEVHAPSGFAHAYRAFCAKGWAGLGADPAHGGRGLPNVLTNLSTEIFGSANHAWLMYTSMSRGGYECIRANGSPAQQALYLPRLASGRWTSSMCITESEAGTDVGLLQTTAQAQDDGSFRLSGLKRLATNAEHDLSENIVHLVLARIAGAPAGTRGLSLFIVPKHLPDAQGRPGPRNAVRCEGLEDKMGIRGTPTCWMRFDRATGSLLGAPGKGLQAMFVMMNIARLATGMQGVNQAERGYQLSLAYAGQRLQGRSPRGAALPQQPADPLHVHADVRRMLLTQRAWLQAGRAFGYWIALQVDISKGHADALVRRDADEVVSLLTPVLKAFATDNGHASAVLAQQVLGGAGYLRESGAVQFVCDARVGQIYEGANGIQGQDLLGRKVLGDGGARLEAFCAQVLSALARVAADSVLQPHVQAMRALLPRIASLTARIGERAAADPDQVGASAHAYLRLIGHLVYGWLWIDMARVAQSKAASSPLHAAKVATAHFYFSHLFPEVEQLLRVADAPASVLAGPEGLFL